MLYRLSQIASLTVVKSCAKLYKFLFFYLVVGNLNNFFKVIYTEPLNLTYFNTCVKSP